MDDLKNLPVEIQILISEFDVEHRNKYKKVMFELKLWKFAMLTENAWFIIDSQIYPFLPVLWHLYHDEEDEELNETS